MISVIVPVYKVEPYLRQCLDSILGQTYKDLQVILIEDGSPDSSGDICDEYAQKDQRIKVFHTENKGLSAARNLGLDEAEGDYISFIDADDWIEPQMLEVLCEALERTGADISACSFVKEFPSSSMFMCIDEMIYEGEEILAALLDKKYNYAVWSRLYRRKLFRNIRFPEGKYYEDISSALAILREAGKLVCISEPLYHYRVRQGSISQTYTAKIIFDFADANLSNYRYFHEHVSELANDMPDRVTRLAAGGIIKVWCWWYGCSDEEKQEYRGRIKELTEFSKNHIPLFGYSSWPLSLRIASLFIHSNNRVTFAVLYFMNQMYRKLKGKSIKE